MGFGYGPKMHQYSVEPLSFPKGATKKHLTFFKTESEFASIFNNPQNYIIAVEKEDSIQGYMVFSFSKQSETNFLLNNLVIKEWIYETPEALLEFSTVFNSQVDQVNRIEWNTQEENIHFFLGDFRNGTNHLIP